MHKKITIPLFHSPRLLSKDFLKSLFVAIFLHGLLLSTFRIIPYFEPNESEVHPFRQVEVEVKPQKKCCSPIIWIAIEPHFEKKLAPKQVFQPNALEGLCVQRDPLFSFDNSIHLHEINW